MKINKHIQIVRSSKQWLSSMSQTSADSLLCALSKRYSQVGISIVNNLSDLEALSALRPDLVFLGMKFIPVEPEACSSDAEKIWVTDYLDEQNIAYTGSGQTAHQLELDKALAKGRVNAAGLATSPFWVVKQSRLDELAGEALPYPLFVKPSDRGSGLGIDSDSVVHNFEQLSTKVRSITENLNSDSLIEQYLPGREFSVAVLEQELSSELLVMPLELIAPPDVNGVRLLGLKVKSANTEQAVAVWDPATESAVSQLAANVFYALGGRDYGRIDIRLDAYGVPHFLEANLLPSLIAGYGSFPKACLLKAGLDYEPMVQAITSLGLVRATTQMREDEDEPVTVLGVEPALSAI